MSHTNCSNVIPTFRVSSIMESLLERATVEAPTAHLAVVDGYGNRRIWLRPVNAGRERSLRSYNLAIYRRSGQLRRDAGRCEKPPNVRERTALGFPKIIHVSNLNSVSALASPLSRAHFAAGLLPAASCASAAAVRETGA